MVAEDGNGIWVGDAGVFAEVKLLLGNSSDKVWHAKPSFSRLLRVKGFIRTIERHQHQPSSDAISRLLGANCTMLLRIRHIGLLSLSKNDGETHTSRKCVNHQYQQGLDTNKGSIHFSH